MPLYQFKLGQLNIQKTPYWHCVHTISVLLRYKCPHAFVSTSVENYIFSLKSKTNKYWPTSRTHIQFLKHLMDVIFVEGFGNNLMAHWLSWSLEGLCGSPLATKSQRGKGDDGTTEYGVQRHLCSWPCKIKGVGLTLYNKCTGELVSINICPRHVYIQYECANGLCIFLVNGHRIPWRIVVLVIFTC